MVASYSYIVMVKPTKEARSVSQEYPNTSFDSVREARKRTVGFAVVFHVPERVVVDVTVKVDVGFDAPVPSVLLDLRFEAVRIPYLPSQVTE